MEYKWLVFFTDENDIFRSNTVTTKMPNPEELDIEQAIPGMCRKILAVTPLPLQHSSTGMKHVD